MVRRDGGRRGPTLPMSMRERIGMPEQKKRRRPDPAVRKAKTQETSKSHRSATAGDRRKFRKVESGDEDELEDEPSDASEESVDDNPVQSVSAKKTRSLLNDVKIAPAESQLLEEQTTEDEPDLLMDKGMSDSDSLSRGFREYSPEVVLDAGSKTFQTRQAEEDEEILALEKKLGMKKSTKIFDDGFDDLLADLDDVADRKNRKLEEMDWLQQKRKKAQAHISTRNDQGSEADSGDSEEDDELSVEAVEADDDFVGFDDQNTVSDVDNDHAAVPQTDGQRKRENPYIAPVDPNNSVQKYVPPSRRKLPEGNSADLTKLRRQTQGLLNKLSESNMISIVDEFEKLYGSNPRQDMHTILTDALLGAFAIPSVLQNTFIILHAAFVAALYKILGADFGAEVLTRVVEAFDGYHQDPGVRGKEALNLVSLLSNLFTFGVISSTLVYDHVKLLLSDFGENSAELLLRILRDCGPQLRASDPASLKEIVQMMNEVSVAMASSGQSINIRTRVMMDTITDLKNNKVRQASNAAGATGEHLTRMRKALGGLNARQLRATEPLGIGRSDILNSEKKGKWWLVGASWKGRDAESMENATPANKTHNSDKIDADGINYAMLFTQYKLTSPVHRSIFVALTTATDARDALQRLQKLRLTRKQEIEIPAVILRTCRAETHFNVYYGALSKMLLREKRYRMPFNVALWKFFGALGEKQIEDDMDAEDDSENEVQISEIGIVAQLYAYLVTKGCLGLDILKTISIGMTKEKTSLFLELFFIAIFNQTLAESKLYELFSSGLDDSRMKVLSYFIKKNVRRSTLVGDSQQRSIVKRNADLAIAALTAQQRSTID